MKTTGQLEKFYTIRLYKNAENKSVTLMQFNSHIKAIEHTENESNKENDFRELNNAIKYYLDAGYIFYPRSIIIK